MRKAVTATKWAASALGASMSEEFASSIHPSAVIDPSVQLNDGVVIEANVVVEKGVKIGANTRIFAGCYIGEDTIIGQNTLLYPFVTLREKTQIGNDVIIHSGVVIGSDGFGYAKEQNGINFKVPQVGYVIIEDDVVIGANTTIDRATLGSTTIRRGSRVGSLVQVGHNVNIGEESTIGNSVGICGSCKIGSSVSIGHGVGMVGHIRIGDHAFVEDGSGISKDVHDYHRIMGAPAMEIEQYASYHEHVSKMQEFINRLLALEEKIGKRSE